MGPTWPYVDVDLRKAIEKAPCRGRAFSSPELRVVDWRRGRRASVLIYVDVPLASYLADGPDDVTKAVRTQPQARRRFHQDPRDGRCTFQRHSPGAQQYRDAEIEAAVVEARRWGRDVAAHAHGADGIKAAIRSGVRTVDHGSELDDEAVALLQR